MDKQKNQNSTYPCGQNNCIFADCVSIADANDGVTFSVAPCMGKEGCPRRYGLSN